MQCLIYVINYMHFCILLKFAYMILILMYIIFRYYMHFPSESVHKRGNSKHFLFIPWLSNRMMHVFPTVPLVITEYMWAVNQVFYPPVSSRMKLSYVITAPSRFQYSNQVLSIPFYDNTVFITLPNVQPKNNTR
jgi:hypothetical protein